MTRDRIVICAALTVIILTGIALGISSARKAGFSNTDDSDKEARWNDLRVFYGAGRWAFKDINFYKSPASPEGRYYIFPPFFAILCAPFALLGWKAFFILWFVVSYAGVLGASALCVRIARPRAKGNTLVALACISLVLCARPIISDFQNGQVNSIIFFLVAASLYLFVRKQDGASGIVMALAASIKLTALIFLPYFLLKGAYRTAGGMALGLVFTLFLLPLISFGPARTARLYSSFYDKMVGPFTSVTDAPEVYSEAGQSLRAAAGRYLTDTNAAHHADYEVRVNFADLPRDTIWKIVLAGCAALTLLTAFCARANPADERRRDLVAVELGAVLLLMLMISPMSRKAHFVALVLPCIAAVNYLLKYSAVRPRPRRWIALLIITAAAFAVFSLTSRDAVGQRLSVLLLALSVFFFAALALWSVFCAILLRERPRISANGREYPAR